MKSNTYINIKHQLGYKTIKYTLVLLTTSIFIYLIMITYADYNLRHNIARTIFLHEITGCNEKKDKVINNEDNKTNHTHVHTKYYKNNKPS